MTGLLPVGTAGVFARNLTPEPERPLPTDPVEWVRGELDEHPWSVQRKILRSVVENRRTAVPSAHGTGKSYTASRIAAYWIASHPVGEAFVVTTAPTGAQVKGILWRELARAHSRGALPGRLSIPKGEGGQAEWYIGSELVGWGRKPQDLTDSKQAMQSFQGIHARYILVILDEATGVPGWLWDAALSLMTNANARILAIGNPDDPTTKFEEVCRPGSGWNVIPVSAFDTPAFTGESVPEVVREGLVSREWVADAEKDYGGKDNPLYQSKVLGIFPDTSDDAVISPAMIRSAQANDLPGLGMGSYGLDVSRMGKDWSALYRVREGVARKVDEWRRLPITAKPGEDSTVARTMLYVRRTPAVPVVVDTDGVGGGAVDGLRALNVRVVPFSMNEAARRPHRFDTRRSEVWWTAREMIMAGQVDLDPADEKLAAQLQAPKWTVDHRGRIHVETKKELAKRGVPSTDYADAVIMPLVVGPNPRTSSPEDRLRAEASRRPREQQRTVRDLGDVGHEIGGLATRPL
jgi:hypothetical protein